MAQGSSIFKDFFQWLREAVTPAALWDGLKTAVWVVPITVMIWVYAEQQQPLDEQSEPFPIEITSGSPNRVITLLHPGDDVPTADLSGPKQSLDQVIAKLNQTGDKRWVHIVVPPELQPGIRDLNIGDEIARADIFRSAGITVKNVHPQFIQIKIDELQTQDVPVTAAPNPNLVDTPIFEPRSVKITAPKTAFADASKSGSIAFVRIPTTGEDAVPGTHTTTLPVETSLTGDNVSIAPPGTVSVTFTVKQSNVRYLDPSIPIRLSFAPSVHPNEVKVDVQETTLPNVEMVGPPDQIEHIKNGDVIPYAELMIDSDDVNASNKPKTLKYEMIEPDVQPVDKNRTITFSATRISPAP